MEEKNSPACATCRRPLHHFSSDDAMKHSTSCNELLHFGRHEMSFDSETDSSLSSILPLGFLEELVTIETNVVSDHMSTDSVDGPSVKLDWGKSRMWVVA